MGQIKAYRSASIYKCGSQNAPLWLGNGMVCRPGRPAGAHVPALFAVRSGFRASLLPPIQLRAHNATDAQA